MNWIVFLIEIVDKMISLGDIRRLIGLWIGNLIINFGVVKEMKKCFINGDLK